MGGPPVKQLLESAVAPLMAGMQSQASGLRVQSATAMHHMLKAAVGGVQAPPDSVERWKKMLQYVKELDSAGSARQQRILQQLQKLVDTQQGSFYSKSKSAKI